MFVRPPVTQQTANAQNKLKCEKKSCRKNTEQMISGLPTPRAEAVLATLLLTARSVVEDVTVPPPAQAEAVVYQV